MKDKNTTVEIDGRDLRNYLQHGKPPPELSIWVRAAIAAFVVLATAGACFLYMLAFYYAKTANIF